MITKRFALVRPRRAFLDAAFPFALIRVDSRLFWVLLSVSALWLACSTPCSAQRGDRQGETQERPAGIEPPQSPPLPAAESLKTIHLADGFHLELAASEPMVQDPVAITFDENGRMFLAEMRGFMPDVDGAGENEPVGRISVLEDTNGDGRMDKATVFLDHLVLPRALAWTDGGLLYAANGKLLFATDPHRDGKVGEITVVDPKYTVGGSPEHQPNGLMRGLDNWYYNANSIYRYRKLDGKWVKAITEFRGQWGITKDNVGRLFYNVNDSQLHGDLIAPNYINRNTNYPSMAGLNLIVATNQRVFTLRMNTAINRAYRPGVLDQRGRALEFSGSCAPFAYRGAQWPEEFQNNVFVCDPGDNIVKRNVIVEHDMQLSSRFAYPDSEFLAATDERCRPVYLAGGPDGTLYVVDMYRGLIQHRIAMTTYLRNETLARGLDQPIHLGRVYRIVWSAAPVKRSSPNLSSLASPALVSLLDHPDGWWRDTAQRLLVERGDATITPALSAMAMHHSNPLARLHALWTLEGLNVRATQSYLKVLSDPHPKLRMAALRVVDSLIARGIEAPGAWLDPLSRLADDPVREVRLQAVLSLGNFPDAAILPIFARVLVAEVKERVFRDAVISGLQGREMEFLRELQHTPGWMTDDKSREEMFEAVAGAATWERRPERITQLLDLMTSTNSQMAWQTKAMLAGMTQYAEEFAFRRIVLAAKPPALDYLAASPDPEINRLTKQCNTMLTWPGDTTRSQLAPEIKPLAGEEKQRFDQGRPLFTSICAGCHGPEGSGLPGLAPPLAHSEWVVGPDERLISIVLSGVGGPLTVNGRKYEPPLSMKEMPQLGILNDEQVAAILTNLRRAWGHQASAISPARVAAVRAKQAGRQTSFTEIELRGLN